MNKELEERFLELIRQVYELGKKLYAIKKRKERKYNYIDNKIIKLFKICTDKYTLQYIHYDTPHFPTKEKAEKIAKYYIDVMNGDEHE